MIKKVIYNYIPALSDGKEVWSENYKEFEVGKGGVKEIIHRRSEWSGDLTDVQVKFEISSYEENFTLDDYGLEEENWDNLSEDDKNMIMDEMRERVTVYVIVEEK